MKKFTLYIFLICLSTLPLSAKAKTKVESVPKSCKVSRPLTLSRPVDNNTYNYFIANQYSDGSHTDTYWDVFSDRSDNQTYYTAANKFPTPIKLDFRQKVRIAKIKDGYACVFDVQEGGYSYPELPGNDRCIGWIPMTNLVLTSYASVNDMGLDTKVLISDSLNPESPGILDAVAYDNPNCDGEFITLPESRQSFYYCVKTGPGGHTLLSKTSEFSDPESVIGWVDNSDIFLWNSRLALEPSHNSSDAASLKKYDTEVEILLCRDGSSAGSIEFSSSSQEGKGKNDFAGGWRCPLLLEMFSNVQYLIPGTSEFLKDRSFPFWVGDQQKNIVFVIDGSRRYEPFFPILADKIQSLGKVAQWEGHLNVGAVIYHDARSEENAIEIHPLTSPSSPDLYEFIDGGGGYGFMDNLSEAPLLSAIYKAAELFNPDADNHIVILGGMGESMEGLYSPGAVIEAFSGRNIHVQALQFNNNDGVAQYKMFPYLMEDIAYSTAIADDDDVCLERHKGEKFTETVFFSGKSMQPLCTYLGTQNLGLMGEDEFSEKLDAITERIIKKDFESSPVFFKHVMSDRTSVDGVPYYSKSALFLESELDYFISFAQNLNDLYRSHNTDRKVLADMISDFCFSCGISATDIKSHGIFRLLRTAQKIRPDDYFYDGPTLSDLQSTSKVSDTYYLFLLKEMSCKYQRMLDVFNNKDAYCSIINSDVYYWVPLENLL